MRTPRRLLLAGMLAVACSGEGPGLGRIPTQLVLTATPVTATAGAPLSPAVRVSVVDFKGSLVTSFAGSVHIALAANPGGAMLTGTTTVNAVGGIATFAQLILDKSGTGYTLTVSASGLKGDTSSALAVSPGPVSTFLSTVNAVPASITASAGSSVSTISVTARDAFGNFIAGATVVLAASGAGNALTQLSATTDTAGVATGTLSSTVAAAKTVSATINGLPVAQTATVTVVSGTATRLGFMIQPSNTVAGTAITPAVAIAARDAFGNVATGYAGSMTVALAANPGLGTLSGTPTVTATSGVATFGDLSIDRAGAGYKLQATGTPALTPDTSTSFDVATGSASRVAFLVQPSSTIGGATITPAVQVEVQDAAGNRVTSATSSVTLAIGTNPKNGSLGGTTTRAAANGIATFNDLTIDSAATGYTLRAAATGLGGATSSSFNITVGPAAQLGFLVQPVNTTGGATLSPAVQVEVRDGGGNRVTTATNSVTMAIGTNPNSGTLGGTKVVAAVNGVATFGTLTIDSAGVGYRLHATAASLTGTTSNTFSVSVGPAAQLGFRVQPASTVSGGSISPAVQVEVRDAGGNRVITASHNITLAILTNPGNGTLLGTTDLSATNGVAIFSNLSIDKAGTGYALQATSSPALTAATSTPFNITSGAAAQLAFSVQPSNGIAGSSIVPAVKVEIQDAQGNRVTSDTRVVTVAILDDPGGGTLSGSTAVSAVAGVATFSSLSIDKAGTAYTLQAISSPALTSTLSVEFDISPGAASRPSFFVEPTTTAAGSSITPAVQVEILDALGNRVGTATNSVTIALLANPGSGSLSGTTSRNASAGVATFNNLGLNKAASGYTLRATASGLTTSDTSVTFAIVPGAATQLVFTSPPSNAVAGTTISPAVQLTARDGQGNIDTAFVGSVTLALGNNAGNGTLSGATTHAAVGGVATFADLSIDKVGTGYTLTAAATGLSGATSSAFHITVGSPARVAFGQQPTSTTGGATISPAVTVRILDANGNLTASSATVTLAITSGTGTAGAHLSGGASLTLPAVSGIATFNTLSIDSAAMAYTLSATSSGLTADTSSAFDVAVGPAARLAFLAQPSTTPPGATITPAVQVEIRDSGGNRVTTATNSVALTIGTNPGAGVLSGGGPTAAVNGVASFANLSINSAGNGYTLVAAATSLIGATSNSFDIVVGTATQLAFSVQPTSTTGGATISPAVQVEIRDAGSNNVTTATNSVTLAIGSNTGSGHLSGTKTVVAVNGVATFSDMSIDSAATGYTLSVTSAGLTGATSNTFDITVGPATKLGFRVQPSNATGGATISPAVQVEIRDAGGNRVTTATNGVTVAIGTNPNDGTLSGTTTVAAVSGQATFGTLRIDSAGTGYRLSAAASGLTSATSNTFNVAVGVAAKLGFLVQPTDAAAGSPIIPAVNVEIRDAGGNRVTTASNDVTLAIGVNPAGGTLGGSGTVGAVSGVATFSTLSVNKAGTGYTLVATATSLTSATSIGFDIMADGVSGSLSTLVAATDTIGQCSFSCVSGIRASTMTVTVQDQFGNPVSGAPVTLSASGAGNDFAPSATGNTDANGVFTTAFNSSVFGAKTVSATAGGVAITQTAAVAVMPVLVGAGDIADCNSIRDDATANQLDSIPGVVFAAGDNAYPNGTATNFANCYDPTWGRHKARTKPIVGNHEYDSSGTAAAYFNYFSPAVADPLGNGYGYYSFDLGTWHIVVLNSDSGVTNPISGPAQLAWLQNDLVGRANQCVLAIWHRPLFTSGASGGAGTRVRRLWQALENAGSEVVINGHDHLYERFAPQDSLGNATPNGIREFIVGTGGGETHAQFNATLAANDQANDSNNFSRGVIRLTLYANSYRWEFIPAAGFGTYTDSGTQACH